MNLGLSRMKNCVHFTINTVLLPFLAVSRKRQILMLVTTYFGILLADSHEIFRKCSVFPALGNDIFLD